MASSSSAQGRLAAAQNMSQAQYQGLLSERQRIREVYAALHTVCDACMTLAAPGAAPIGLDLDWQSGLYRADLAVGSPQPLTPGVRR